MRFLFKAMLWFFGVTIFLVIVFKWVPIPYTPLMAVRAMESRPEGKKPYEGHHDWVPIEKISKNMQRAVIASEDGNFLTHHGFDFNAIQKAMDNNEKGKKLKGGSTISQQTAKNVFLWQGRSYLRKGLEAYFTVLIELIWGKERIMEVYLNSIEMGDGVFGVQAASKYWYRKDADKLSKREAAGIAAILPSPRRYTATNSTSYIERRKSRIVKHMAYVGKLDY
ncbi:monofunctional biosynthetic peptidoglycan transglycosylase [Flavobacterium sp. 3HN19-14]|uniref:monofunctional biosynthetic peptidoglycan transglycosylase n=1 Tax=Flavobacterium sp. 3HN19-14 TaxID=3448133 RepID=UPI003EE177A8